MRKSLTAIVAVAALGFISACGASGGTDSTAKDDKAATTTTAAAKTTTTAAADDAVAVTDWADDFCGNFSAWLDEIKSASSGVTDSITPGDMESAKTAIAGLFESASTATQDLISQLQDGGAPDIEDGDQLVEDLITKFQAFDDAAQTAKADTEALATDDATTFQSDADELTTRFQDEVNTVADSFGEIDTKYPSSELQDALSSSCDF